MAPKLKWRAGETTAGQEACGNFSFNFRSIVVAVVPVVVVVVAINHHHHH